MKSLTLSATTRIIAKSTANKYRKFVVIDAWCHKFILNVERQPKVGVHLVDTIGFPPDVLGFLSTGFETGIRWKGQVKDTSGPDFQETCQYLPPTTI